MTYPLVDNFGRPVNYLRLAVTDRCNLRCFYCMPEQGIQYLPKKELLTYEELLELTSIFCEMGITKIRITGGEPFVRRDMIVFLEKLRATPGLEELHLTTNGVLTGQYIPQLKDMGINSVNLSLDTLDPHRFFTITRRDVFTQVKNTFDQLLEAGIPLKINMVVMSGRNNSDIIPMAELTKNYPVVVRYIEEMPFNGDGHQPVDTYWDHTAILKALTSHYKNIDKLTDPPFSTSSNYQIPGYVGTIGIIAAYSRTFCGSCNRIRLTSEGMVKTCLYDNGRLNIKDLIRTAGWSREEIKGSIRNVLSNRHRDGHAAEASREGQIGESMSTIGG